MMTMISFQAADFDRYAAIELMVFDIFSGEMDADFDDVVAFAASLGVLFTAWDWTSLGIDFDEM